MHESLDTEDAPLPVGLLNACREQLAAQVTVEQARPAIGLAGRMREWMSSIRFTPQLMLRPVGGLALIAVGFFGARLEGETVRRSGPLAAAG